MMGEIREELFRLRDEKYRAFQTKLIPTVEQDAIIGVRTPELRRFARELLKRGGVSPFLEDLPHRYFDENQLHAFILSEMKDFPRCLEGVERFLPYIDNWATCDQLSPKVFSRHREALAARIPEWLSSGQAYTVRFGIGMLMQHFLGDAYDPAWPETVAGIRSGEYYVNMMIAWYFATALAKRYEDAVPYLEERRLAARTHNMAIRKALESRRIAPERKAYLKSLKAGEK